MKKSIRYTSNGIETATSVICNFFRTIAYLNMDNLVLWAKSEYNGDTVDKSRGMMEYWIDKDEVLFR